MEFRIKEWTASVFHTGEHSVSLAIVFKGHSQFSNMQSAETTIREHYTLLFFVYVRNFRVLTSDYGFRHFQQISCFPKTLILKKKTILLFLYVNIWTVLDTQRRESSVWVGKTRKTALFSAFLHWLFLLSYFWMIQSLKELRV